MKKQVAIFEDSGIDAIRRYSEIARSIEGTFLYLIGDEYSSGGGISGEELAKGGFSLEKVRRVESLEELFENSVPINFDAYFFDGLNKRCFLAIDKFSLPRDKCFINTSSWDLQEEAEEKGYQLLRGSCLSVI